MSLSTLPSDILSEILDYFRYDVAEYTTTMWLNLLEEYRETRKTLLAAALTTRQLSAVALDLLWRDMLSLQPVLQVIEALSSSPIFYFRDVAGDELEAGHRERLNHDHPNFDHILRVQSYLSRIKHLEIVDPSPKEYTLWTMLVDYLKHDGPLLPELRMLRVKWRSPGSPPVYPLLNPLVTSTIRKFELFLRSDDFHGNQVLRHLHLINCNLRSLSLTINPQKSMLSFLQSFSSLHELSLNYPRTSPSASANPEFSPQELLVSIPTVRCLTLNLNAVRLGSQPSVCNNITLQSLNITGGSFDLIRFFTKDIISPAMTTLDIFIAGYPILISWKDLFSAIVHAFPNLRSLQLDHHGPVEATRCLCIPDLLPAFEGLKFLTHLVLPQVGSAFSSADVNSILQAWPELESLRLGFSTVFDAAVLGYIAGNSLLKSISIRVDIAPLFDPVTKATNFSRKSLDKPPHLTQITILDPPIFPSTLEQKVALVQNLLALFPKLDRILFTSWPDQVELEKELDTLLSTFRAVYKGTHCDGMREKST